MDWLRGGICWISYGPLSSSPLGWTDGLAWGWLSVVGQLPVCVQNLGDPWDAWSCRDMRCPDANILANCVFQGWFLTLGDFSREVQSAPKGWCLVSAGDHPDQTDCSTEWQGKLSLFLSIPYIYMVTGCFPHQLEFITANVWCYKTGY